MKPCAECGKQFDGIFSLCPNCWERDKKKRLLEEARQVIEKSESLERGTTPVGLVYLLDKDAKTVTLENPELLRDDYVFNYHTRLIWAFAHWGYQVKEKGASVQ